MTDLRDRLDDLVVGVPAHVLREDLAARAWRGGRRRRWRRRVLAVAALVTVALLAIPVLRQPPAMAPADGGSGVHVYPQRITHQWWTPGLPDRPGPLAGLLRRNGEGDWYAVSPNGDLWPVPTAVPFAVYPTLSGNGRYLGYYFNPAGRMVGTDGGGQYLIRDLVTGRTTAFAGRQVEEQSPAFWTSDNQRLAIWAAADARGSGPRAVVLGVDGSIVVVPSPEGVQLAGWAGDSTLVWVAGGKAIRTGLDGAVRSEVTLRPSSPLEGTFGQHTAVVAGDDLLVRSGGFGAVQWRTFRLSDGAEVAPPQRAYDDDETCPVTLRRGIPIRPEYDSPGIRTLAASGQEPLAVVDPQLEAACVMFAADAVNGEPDRDLFGLAQAGWLWWWREILAGVALLVVAAFLTVVARRRVGGGLAVRPR